MGRPKKAAAPAAESQVLSEATQALATTLAAALRPQQAPSADLKVGIRNISDNTIGVTPPKGTDEPELDLHADVPGQESAPGKVAVISYAWWKQIRKSDLMDRGEIMRDDSVLGESFSAAPPDRPDEIAPGWFANAVVDPVKWINEKANEAELRTALDKITSLPSLRRIRRVVDMELRKLEKQFHPDPQRAKKALQALPALYQMLDHVITMKLERPDDV